MNPLGREALFAELGLTQAEKTYVLEQSLAMPPLTGERRERLHALLRRTSPGTGRTCSQDAA